MPAKSLFTNPASKKQLAKANQYLTEVGHEQLAEGTSLGIIWQTLVSARPDLGHPARRNQKGITDWLKLLGTHKHKRAMERGWSSYRSMIDTIHRFYKSPEWRQIRPKILKRDGHTCKYCGASPKNLGHENIILHVDHIKPLSRFWELRLDPNNLQCLCEDCNMAKGSKLEEEMAVCPPR